MLLDSGPSHGYDLYKALTSCGVEVGDRAVYHELKLLEREDLLTSRWDISSRGPTHRVYALASAGRDALQRGARRATTPPTTASKPGRARLRDPRRA